MQNFFELGLPQPLVNSLKSKNFNIPTPVQAQAIPPALEGKDILGSAQTGTGKTLAFGIPLMAKLLSSPRGSALVLTPTRELAVQVMKALEQLVDRNSNIKTALIIGGESMPKQFKQLQARPRLIVGTPGRINDHLLRGSLLLHDTNFLVLDETDRMLDMGFGVQLDKIAKYLPKVRQTLMFSATLPGNIMQLSSKYLTDPLRITVGSTTTAAPKIKQETIFVSQEEKYGKLVSELDKREGSIIVFVKTKWGAEKLAARLSREHHDADAIHGDLRQNQRDRVINGFRNRKYRILVATDIAARGLDIPHIEHVINYDLPQCPEDYIHRIGRTARAGAEGEAICFITGEDRGKWRAIERLMNPDKKFEKFDNSNNRSDNRSRSNNRNDRRDRSDRFERSDRRERGDRFERSDRQEGSEGAPRQDNGDGAGKNFKRNKWKSFGGFKKGGSKPRFKRKAA